MMGSNNGGCCWSSMPQSTFLINSHLFPRVLPHSSKPMSYDHEFLSSCISLCPSCISSSASESSFVTSQTIRCSSLSSASPPFSRMPGNRKDKEQELCLVISDADNEIDLNSREAIMLDALKDRKTDEAWQSYQYLIARGRIPNSVCLSRLVAQLSYQGTPSSLSKAQKLVSAVQRQRQATLLDCNSLGLLAMATAKAGAARYASTIIRLMLKLGLAPNVKAWSAVISKLGKHKEDVPLALSLFEDICRRVREAEEKTPGTQVMDGWSEDRTNSTVKMRPDTGAFNAVVNACANVGMVERAEQLLDELYTFGLGPDVLTFNIMIKLYGMSDNTEKLSTILDQMEHAGVKPRLSTMHSLVAAYVGLDDLERAVRLVQALKEGRDDISSIVSSEILAVNDLLGKDSVDVLSLTTAEIADSVKASTGASPTITKGNTEDIKMAPKSRFKPDARMYTILMKGFMQKQRFNDVMQLLFAMQMQEDTESWPNEVTYTTAISACVQEGLLDDARMILLEMAARKVPANTVTYNVLMNGYCKALQISKARLLLEDMRKTGIQPDVVSYNTLIDGYINMDDSASALVVFTLMRESGIAPSKVSYTALIKGFSMNNQPHLAAKVFEEMEQDSQMKVDVIAWNVLIESYGKAGLVELAKESFKKMKEQGHEPTVATYGSLVKAFSAAGKSGDVLVLWKEIRERLDGKEARVNSFKPDPGLLDGLVDICVRAGFFQRALEIVACMEKHQIPADKIKYKRMFVELHSKLYTSKHTSQGRRDRTADRRRAVEAFKFWVGLPNKYYESNWSP